jgi:hypothetical protein
MNEPKTLIQLAQELGRLEKSRDHHVEKAKLAEEEIVQIKNEIKERLSTNDYSPMGDSDGRPN